MNLITLAERGYVSDFLIRAGIRGLLRRRLKSLDQERASRSVVDLRGSCKIAFSGANRCRQRETLRSTRRVF